MFGSCHHFFCVFVLDVGRFNWLGVILAFTAFYTRAGI